MKNTKKFLAILLSLSLTAGAAACGKKDEEKTGDSKADDSKAESTEGSEETEATEATTTEPEETEPAIPDGYELVSFTDTQFGAEISFCVLSGGSVKQVYDDKYYTYEMEDESYDGYVIGYEYNIYAADLTDEDWEYKIGDYETIDGTNYPCMLNAYDNSINYLTLYGGEFYNGKYMLKLTITNSQEVLPEDEFRAVVETVAKTVSITSIGTDEFTNDDGTYNCSSTYAKIGNSMSIDGKTLTPYLFVESGESGYPYWKVDFDSDAGDHVAIESRGGYNGTYYQARLDNEDFRQCVIGGYPAICSLSNSFGTLVAHYSVVMGYMEKETSEGKKYEEDLDIYIVLDGDYSDEFLADLFNGTDHPELYERMDAYASGFMNAVIYTPGEGSTPVEKAA